MFYLDQIFYKFTINLTKLSILTLYLRIFTQTWFVRTCWCLFALVTAYAIASIIATVFQCTPINFYWDRLAPPSTASGPEGEGDLAISNKPHCISTTAFWLANAVYNISTDIIILVTLPFMIWSLRLPKSQKIGLTVVFGLGVFVFATSVLRLTTLESGSTAKDPLVGTVSSTMWTMIEASTAVICACLPMCRTPLQRVWPKLFPSKYASAGGAQTQSDSPVDGSGTAGAGSPGGITGKGSLRVNMPNGMMSGPRETSGGMWAGHRGPGGRTLEDEEEFEDLEMQPVSSSKEETDRKGIIRGVVPVRMKGW